MDFKALLFTKEYCIPCTLTKDNMVIMLKELPELKSYITTLQKEKHESLVETYKIEKFPSLLIVDGEGQEMTRLVGGQVIREDLRGVLIALRAVNK